MNSGEFKILVADLHRQIGQTDDLGVAHSGSLYTAQLQIGSMVFSMEFDLENLPNSLSLRCDFGSLEVVAPTQAMQRLLRLNYLRNPADGSFGIDESHTKAVWVCTCKAREGMDQTILTLIYKVALEALCWRGENTPS
jgi:hypothetical protein